MVRKETNISERSGSSRFDALIYENRIKKICELCGREYWTGNGKAKYCSDECRKAAHKAKIKIWADEHKDYRKDWLKAHPDYAKEWRAKHPNYDTERTRKRRGTVELHKTCIVCGKDFTTYYPSEVTCCADCARMWRNGHSERRLRLMRDNGNMDTTITIDKLIERDKGICYICGCKVDPDDYTVENGIKCIGKNYPTIDHVIPLSKGGTHSWDNIRLAHMVCNSIKGVNGNG